MPLKATFPHNISYRQIAVFDSTLELPFNDWRPEHSRQGFTWREGSVSFSTLMDSGLVQVEVTIGDSSTFHKEAECRIEVPFNIPEHGQVSVASILDERHLEMEAGSYQLICEAFGQQLRLQFISSNRRAFHIYKQDDPSKSLEVLTTQAEPAE